MKTAAFINISRLLTLFIPCFALVAQAAGTFMVTTNSDSGPGSLRQAVADANVNGGTIVFSNVAGTITLTSGQLVFTNNLTIVGPGQTNLAVSGGNVGRVFRNDSGATSSISRLTITGGRWGGGLDGSVGGAGLYNAGDLTLSNCVISGNTFVPSTFPYSALGGGGIGNQGTLRIESCAVFGNLAGRLDLPPPGWGGGILNLGVLIMNNSSVSGNSAIAPSDTFGGSPSRGGGIYNEGSLSISHSTIASNACGEGTRSPGTGKDGGSGGGIYNISFASMKDCTFSGNRTGGGGAGGFGPDGNGFPGGNGGNGGAIYNAAGIYLTNCTIYGNFTGAGGQGGGTFGGMPGNGGNGGDGAGVYNAETGTLVAASCTISAGVTGGGGLGGNPPPFGPPGNPGRGGGIWHQAGSVQLLNSLLASNTASGGAPDAGGSFTSLGHNLISNTNGSVGFPGSNDLLNIDAKLGPLTNNGGPTLTCALLSGSPAFDAGDDSLTGTDQRGLPRPSGAHVDIGAFEVQIPNGPPHLTGPWRLGNGGLRFSFTNTPGASFTVLGTTNVAQPSTNWSVLGSAVENPPGWFEFTEPTTTNPAQRFYQIRWP